MELVVEPKGGKKPITYHWYSLRLGQNGFKLVDEGKGKNRLKITVKNQTYDYRCIIQTKDWKILGTIPVRVEKR